MKVNEMFKRGGFCVRPCKICFSVPSHHLAACGPWGFLEVCRMSLLWRSQGLVRALQVCRMSPPLVHTMPRDLGIADAKPGFRGLHM